LALTSLSAAATQGATVQAHMMHRTHRTHMAH
jgi:hypothetical protein